MLPHQLRSREARDATAKTTSIAPTLTSLVNFQLLQLPTEIMLFLEDVNRSVWVKHSDGITFTDANNGATLADALYGTDGRPFGAVLVP